MSADIHTLPPRRPRLVRTEREHPHVYTCLLLRDDVTIGELAHALRFTGIVLTTDPASGQQLIHRSPTPPPAA